MMQELTYAFPILSWLVFVPVIVALVMWARSEQGRAGETALGMSGLDAQRLNQGEVVPSMLPR